MPLMPPSEDFLHAYRLGPGTRRLDFCDHGIDVPFLAEASEPGNRVVTARDDDLLASLDLASNSERWALASPTLTVIVT